MRALLKSVIIVLVMLIVLLLGLGSGVVLDRTILTASAQTTKTANAPDLGLLSEAYRIIQQHYVDRSAVQEPQLTYGAISGMVDSLGDTGHTVFMSPQSVQQENRQIQGYFEGIGAEVQKKGDNVVIVAPIDGTPAQKAGLKPGDIILKVNGEDMTGKSVDQVVTKILGPAGTPVTVTIQRLSTGETKDYTIVRARIQVASVTWSKIPGTTIADIRLSSFSQGVGDGLKKALAAIKQDGTYTGIVLDLRNNPGGLLSEAVGVTSQFLSEGDVLLEKDAQGNIQHVPVDKSQAATSIPLVVLINNGTASAPEIVSGSLQDYGRAKLVGETTFGTGTVLNQFPLSDGSALQVATQEWLTPKGRVIWHKGIDPDVSATVQSGATPVVPESMKGLTPAQLRASGDDQLIKAIGVLDPSFLQTGMLQSVTQGN